MKNFSEFLSNNLFEFENRSCEYQKKTIFDAPGQAPHFKLKVCSIADKGNIKFSYSPQKGLNQAGNAGGLISENILGQPLALPHNDINAVIPFLEKYGFLFPISDE